MKNLNESLKANITWEDQAFGGERSIISRFHKVWEESQEIFDPLSKLHPDQINDMTLDQKQYFIEELGDLILIAHGTLTALGGDPDEVIARKQSIIPEKYPPEAIQQAVDSGMTHEQAMNHLKRNWKKERPCEAPEHVEDCNGKGITEDHFTPRAIGKELGWSHQRINALDNRQGLSKPCHTEKDRTTSARLDEVRRQLQGEMFKLGDHTT